MPFFGIHHFRKSAPIPKEMTCEPNPSVVSFLPGLALMKTTVLEPMRTLSYFRLDTLGTVVIVSERMGSLLPYPVNVFPRHEPEG